MFLEGLTTECVCSTDALIHSFHVVYAVGISAQVLTPAQV